jgi:myo-inositol-1(or 4)-monophosphatase
MRIFSFILIFLSISMGSIHSNADPMKHPVLPNIENLSQEKILEQCVELFRATFYDYEKRNEVAFQTKSDGSLVSNLELEIETVIGGFLKEKTPWAGFQGEEGICYDATVGGNEYRWYLDPIDGTTSFHNRWDTFAFTLTLVKNSEALATVIDFPRLSRTYIAYLGLGAFLNQKPITLKGALQSEKPIFALSDQYTFEMTQREAVLHKLRSLPYIPRTVTDIYGYCMVAEGKCIAKFDAAGALWDLWPGYLLIREAGGKCLFFSLPQQTEDLVGSMLVGHPEIIDRIYTILNESIDEGILPTPDEKPSMRAP